MDNPVGYLYLVGRNRARRLFKARPATPLRYPTPATDTAPWFEPALAGALTTLSERERAVVLLPHGLDWTMSEVAGIQRAAVTAGPSCVRRIIGWRVVTGLAT